MSPQPPASAPHHPAPAPVEDVAVGAIWTPIARDPAAPGAAIRFYTTPRHNRRRVTLIGERFDLRPPCAEAATAVILATVLANRLQADLRLITRSDAVEPTRIDQLLQLHGLALRGESILQWVPTQGADVELDRFDDELVLAASCESAAAALAAAPLRDVVCLLQSDERLLQAQVVERMRCQALLQRQDLRFVVNSQSLKAWLIEQGLPHFGTSALVFEPAYPLRASHAGPHVQTGPRRLLFHAPARGSSALFARGLAAIEQALSLGLLDPQRWAFSFIGRGLPEVALAGWQRPQQLQDTDADAYARLLGETDLALVLGAPGSTSGNAMEIAASGAVVVSNTFLKATSEALADSHGFAGRTVACGDETASMLQGLQQGAARLAADAVKAQAPIRRDWTQALQGVVETLAVGR